tara:strand:- start:1280 stop:1741 length:462 start_codon:yes stop_codon:yes gene_type:complete
MAKIETALRMALRAHEGQTDKIGRPYIYHVLDVFGAVRGEGEDVECVALLHDAVEDSGLIVPQVRQALGDTIADAVDAMTKREGESYFEDYLPRVLANPLARRVKNADARNNYARLNFIADEATRDRLEGKYARVISATGVRWLDAKHEKAET